MKFAYLCWDHSEGWIDEYVAEDEREAKEWEYYIKITLPQNPRTVGKCVGIVPAPK